MTFLLDKKETGVVPRGPFLITIQKGKRIDKHFMKPIAIPLL